MTHNTDPLTLKLSLREKCAYGMGDFGSNLMLCIGTLYLLKFYTDELGMPAFYGGIIFLVAKFFTAFTDMLTGVLLDSRRNIGAKGKFRPFILYASVPVALVATAQFMANDFSLTVKTALATVLFMMFGLCYSLMNCAYGAMVPAITKTRTSAHSLRRGVRAAQPWGCCSAPSALCPFRRCSSASPPSAIWWRRWCSSPVACSACGGATAA